MPPIRVNPTIAANSLRVIAATSTDGDNSTATTATGASPARANTKGVPVSAPRGLDLAAIEAAEAAPASDRTAIIFHHIAKLSEAKAV